MAGAVDYLLAHRESPPPPGILRLGQDFAVPPEPGPPPPEPVPGPDIGWEAVRDVAAELQRLVRQAQADRCPYDATLAQYRASMARIMDHDIGPIVDYAAQLAALAESRLGKPSPAPGPEPSPVPAPPPSPPPGIRAFAVSYSGHDPARDVYPGLDLDQVEWGPHHGVALTAPTAGTVQAYQFPTPLSVYQAMDPAARLIARQLWCGWSCCLPTLADACRTHTVDLPLSDQWWVYDTVQPYQTMYVAVFVPDAPLVISGKTVRLLVYGHVRNDIRTGRVTRGEQFATVWDSGIRFEAVGVQARAAHVHCAASTTGQVSANGDVDGLLAATALGWTVEWRGQGPGPNEYMSGQWVAGRRRSDFERAGRSLPPVPSP